VTTPAGPGRISSLLGWTRHPGFGVLVLLALAVVLIWHGEPQPSSRPSGTSVAVSGTASANGPVPGLLVVQDGKLELLQQDRATRAVPLPQGAVPRSVITNRGLSVVLAVLDGKQRAYAVTSKLAVLDLGYADAVLPAVRGGAAVLVETALVDPGRPEPPPASAGSSASVSPTGSASESPSSPLPGPPPLRDYSIRRYDNAGLPTEPSDRLPRGYRAAVDTSVGLVVWQPVNRVYDSGVIQESLSASALLIRPDASRRPLGPVHPLAANDSQLLVWDVVLRRFGVMPLNYVDSTATSTATPSESATPSRSVSPSGSTGDSSSAKPRPAPTVVAGTRWFLPTRGMLLITGPAAFSGDGTAFAVYAQVGSRRRLVVAQLKDLGTDQVEVLVLNQPPAKSSPVPSGSGQSGSVQSGSGQSGSAPVQTGAVQSGAVPSGSSLVLPSPSGTGSSSASASPTVPALQPDGYPIPAPAAPVWLADDQVVAVAQDGTVIGYRPGGLQSAALDLGVKAVRALAPAP
jgi:hypothetical protein